MIRVERAVGAVLAFVVVMLSLTAAFAGEPVRIGRIQVESAWARASIGTARPSAAYLTIVNLGDAPDQLLKIETPVAGRAEVHRTVRQGGIMKMKPAGAIAVPAGGKVALKPGGLHIMLMDLRQPLKKGGTFPLTLVFENNGSGTVDVAVAGPGAMRPPQ
jgi:hypothetical protein